jgi:N-acetylglucosaminyldiphosphoundecaprenol N-acetyl-beta-D-mannosaminyltransferase
MGEAVARCEDFIHSGSVAQHLAVNAAKLVAMHDDARLWEVARQCDLVTADGQAVVWASRILGDPLPARVAGIDLMDRLLERAEKKGYSVYILGAAEDVLQRAVERIRARYPRVSLLGYGNGYFREAEEPAIVQEIADLRPDILFVGLSTPRKELFLEAYRQVMGVPFVMGVGGAIDVVAGRTRRAPLLLQRLGLEWLFRFLQEPRRLLHRYTVTNMRFALLLCRHVASRRLVRAFRGGRAV